MPNKRGPYTRKPKAKAPGPKLNFVREWREHFDMTQEDLAAEAELSVPSISAYERGDNQPSIEALGKLAKVWGIPKGMILDVNPQDDPSIWDGYLRATETQKREIDRIIGALVGAPKRRR
jgi:transcriptional regulator with XRE-family HTH domain